MTKNGQTDGKTDRQKRRTVTHLEIPTLSFGNAGPQIQSIRISLMQRLSP